MVLYVEEVGTWSSLYVEEVGGFVRRGGRWFVRRGGR